MTHQMIDPLTVAVYIPAMDGRCDCLTTGGMVACAAAHLFGNFNFNIGTSDVRLARNLMVANFLKLPEQFQWLVLIDSDIGFTENDFRLLLDYPQAGREFSGERNPEGTTLTDDGHALIVNAEYSRKVDSLDPVRFGLGFTRIHRSVFTRLIESQELFHEVTELKKFIDGPLAENMPGELLGELEHRLFKQVGLVETQPRVGSFVWKGEVYHDFFANGPGFEGTWFGEDTGFFHLCRLTGITPRIEQRTRLLHVGRKVHPYVGGVSQQAVDDPLL